MMRVLKFLVRKFLEMLDEANIAPSSCNFQPWRYIVVDTPEGKEKLGKANFNKTQNDTSSAMIILLGDLSYFDKFDENLWFCSRRRSYDRRSKKKKSERVLRE